MNRLRELDPNQALCGNFDSRSAIKAVLLKLAPEKQFELAKGWGLVEAKPAKGTSFSMLQLNQNDLDNRLSEFCAR